MKEQPPLITVFITCYNEGPLLLEAVESLDQQTDRDFEVVIVNDRSPDTETQRICETLERERRLRVVWHEQNRGLSGARDSGFEAMSGEIAVPLDADDILPPDAVADIRKGFESRPNADFLFGNYLVRKRESGEERLFRARPWAGSDGRLMPGRLVKHWRLLGTSPCKKTVWERIGGYRDRYANDLQDKDFWIRAIDAGAKGYYLDRPIYVWNRSEKGMNSGVPQSTQDTLVREHIAFFERHWEPPDALNWFVQAGEFSRLKTYARRCLSKRIVNLRLLYICLMPLSALRFYYAWRGKR